MDLFTIAGACLRRWYVTTPLLLIVACFSYAAYAAVDPLYTSSRSVVVLPSLEEEVVAAPDDEAATTVEVENPYSGQGGSRFAVAVLTRNINSTIFEERLDLDEELVQGYEASSSSEQPMIHIEATGASAEAVYEVLDRVVDDAAVVLDEFQAEAGAPELTRYRIAPAVPAGPVEDATPSRLRAAGAIAVLGGGLVAAVVVGADALLTNRRRRQDAPAGQVEADSRPATHAGTHHRDPRHREDSAQVDPGKPADEGPSVDGQHPSDAADPVRVPAKE